MAGADYTIAAFGHHPDLFAARSGMLPLADALGAERICYNISWQNLQKRSWRLGQMLQAWGNAWYASEWNAVIPWLDEVRLARRIPKAGRHVNLFLWGEFFTPKKQGRFKRPDQINVGCFHATAWRQPQVLENFDRFDFYDQIVLMSETQRPFILEKGFPEERLHVILHGVDTAYYAPNPAFSHPQEGPLQGIMVGGTERDHKFLATLLKALPEGTLEIKAAIPEGQKVNYEGAPNITFCPRLSDEAFLRLYQEAELLVLPMNDCTANNTVMEAMACGTPVLVNAVGGIPEYVSAKHGFILPSKDVDDWCRHIVELHANRQRLAGMRSGVRSWAKQFSWMSVASSYTKLFNQTLN